jgi:hypothetical protein
VDEDAHAIRGEAEIAGCLDYLEALVGHGGRVDGDLPAHAPVRMASRLIGLDHGEFGQLPVAKGPPRGGDDELVNLLGPDLRDELEEGCVLRIDGQYRGPGFPGQLVEEGPRHDHALLVREDEGLPARQRREGGPEPAGACRAVHDDVGFDPGDQFVEPIGADESDPFDGRRAAAQAQGGSGEEQGLEAEALFVRMGSEPGHLEEVGPRLDDVDGLAPDGTGGPDYDYALAHTTPRRIAGSRAYEIATRPANAFSGSIPAGGRGRRRRERRRGGCRRCPGSRRVPAPRCPNP